MEERTAKLVVGDIVIIKRHLPGYSTERVEGCLGKVLRVYGQVAGLIGLYEPQAALLGLRSVDLMCWWYVYPDYITLYDGEDKHLLLEEDFVHGGLW